MVYLLPKVHNKAHYGLEMGVFKWAAPYYADGESQPYSKRSKIPFTHERFQIVQKLNVHELGKL